MTLRDDNQPDWPPSSSAAAHPEGTRKYGSTGQLWQVRSGQWVRLTMPRVVPGVNGERTPVCDHDWEEGNPGVMNSHRCLRCGEWR